MDMGDLIISCPECKEDTVVNKYCLESNYSTCDVCEKIINTDWVTVGLVFALLERVEKLEKDND
jgi:hypothetical protein